LPDKYALNQNYPNPFNTNTKVSYSLPELSKVKISVYNSLGQLIKPPTSEVRDAGKYNYIFDGADLSSGVYFCKFNAKSVTSNRVFESSIKMILLK